MEEFACSVSLLRSPVPANAGVFRFIMFSSFSYQSLLSSQSVIFLISSSLFTHHSFSQEHVGIQLPKACTPFERKGILLSPQDSYLVWNYSRFSLLAMVCVKSGTNPGVLSVRFGCLMLTLAALHCLLLQPALCSEWRTKAEDSQSPAH